jgi:hypothetical protein
MILTENDLIRNISSKTWPDGIVIVIVQQPGTSAARPKPGEDGPPDRSRRQP